MVNHWLRINRYLGRLLWLFCFVCLSGLSASAATLTVELPESVTEGQGNLEDAGRIVFSEPQAQVFIVSDDEALVSIHGFEGGRSVIMPTETLSAPCDLLVGDNALIDGPRTVTITASSDIFPEPGSATLSVIDDDGGGGSAESRFPAIAAGGTTMEGISDNHMIAVDCGARVWTWGRNSEGQLGRFREGIDPIPGQVKDLSSACPWISSQQIPPILIPLGKT